MIYDMTNAPLTNSISHNFIVQMIPHHRAAIEMSRNLLQYTTFLPLQDIAEQIIEEQTQSIADMRRIERICSEQVNSDFQLRCYQQQMNRIKQIMFSAMGSACSANNINGNFMREMIPHHCGAVEMSTLTLENNICPQLHPILNSIITSQRRGIQQMNRLLRDTNCC